MNEIIETLAWTCIHSLWIGALVAGLLALFLNVISESRSQIRYAVAWFSLLAVIVLSIALTRFSNPIIGLNFQVSLSFQVAIAALWVAGFIVSLVRLVEGSLRVLAMRRESSQIEDSDISEVFKSVKTRFGICRNVSLRSSELISGPVLIGWISPMVLIPVAWLNGVPIPHLAAVFAHELAHARRCDFIANLIQKTLESALFFNPAVWWIGSVIRREREHACDDSALPFTEGATHYSRALVWFESYRLAQKPNPLALAFGDGGPIENRINRLLRVSNGDRKLSPMAAISGISILTVMLVLVTVMIGGARLFAKSSQELADVHIPSALPQTGVEIEEPPSNPDGIPPLFETEIEWNSSARPLFVSVPIIERNGVLYDLRHREPALFPDIPNRYVMEKRLNFLDSNLPNRDSDGDGFSVVEEYQASTDPKDPGAHPAYVEKLKFKSRKSQAYKIKFGARPDGAHFQLIREPTAKWPKRETFIVKEGETTADGQLKVGKLIEREQVVNGIRRDSSILEATFIPTGEKLELQSHVSTTAAIYFAEFESTIPRAEKFYVKKGEPFVVPGDPEKWTLREVKEDSCTIFRKGDDGKEIVKTIEKAK